MLIDWFTVGAQALNFIILVWLLKHFLYKPILTAIDAREKRIATELAEAARQKSEAQKERDEFQDKNRQFGEERDALMAKAVLELKANDERLLDNARKLANQVLTEQKIDAQANIAALANQLKRLAATEVFDIARKVLTDLASADLEDQLAEVFTRRLRQLTPEAKASLGAMLKASNGPAIIRSRFRLSAKAQATIQKALNETFSADIGLSFETAPDTVCGIELTAGGQRLSWDIAEYLKVLDEKVEALIGADAKSASAMPVVKAPPVGWSMLASPASEPPARALNGPTHAIAS